MEENKPKNDAPVSGVYNLGTGDKKPSILGKLLGDGFGALAKKKTDGGSLLGAVIGAQIAQDAKQAQAAPKTASIASLLGGAPQFDPVALEERNRRSEHRARSFFYAAIGFALIVFGTFQYFLNPEIGVLLGKQNVAQQFTQSNEEVKKNQTDINVVQYRIARLWFDVLNSKIDQFNALMNLQKDSKATLEQRAENQKRTETVANEIKQSLTAVQQIFAQPLGIDTYTETPVSLADREVVFNKLLKDSLIAQRESLRGAAQSAKDGVAAQKSNDERAIESVIRLVDNKKVKALVRSAEVKDMTNEELSELLNEIRAEGIDDLAQVQKLKEQRINWVSLINTIHEVVRTADPHYGSGLLKTVGGFMFTQYRFDAKTGRVSISGTTRTTDSKTFSFISTLVDAIEKSPNFKDIDFRSFNKTRDESGDFSAEVNLEFGIEK